MSGEEIGGAGVPRIESPTRESSESRAVISCTAWFLLLCFVFCRDDYSDDVRRGFLENLIGGLPHEPGRAVLYSPGFHGFVVVIGTLILAGAVNTPLWAPTECSTRVSEDGVLSDWFRQPHPRYGTSYRIVNISRFSANHNHYHQPRHVLPGEPLCFGVIWSFAMNGLAVLVLRYTRAGSARIPVR